MLNQLIDHGHDLRVLALPRSAAPLHCMAISAGYEQRRNEVYSWDGLQRGTAPFLVIQHTLVVTQTVGPLAFRREYHAPDAEAQALEHTA